MAVDGSKKFQEMLIRKPSSLVGKKDWLMEVEMD